MVRARLLRKLADKDESVRGEGISELDLAGDYSEKVVAAVVERLKNDESDEVKLFAAYTSRMSPKRC